MATGAGARISSCPGRPTRVRSVTGWRWRLNSRFSPNRPAAPPPRLHPHSPPLSTRVRPNSREGVGKMELANGDKYVGEWRDDQIHGKGKYLSEEGEYDGHWEAGLREGQVRVRGLCRNL